MLDGNDNATFYAIRQLRDLIAEHEKPVIIWVGAGASMWCGFPSWQDTAARLHAVYRKYEPAYEKAEGQRLLQAAEFPALFELLRRTDSQRYYRELPQLFTARAPTPVYARFLGIVKGLAPLQIVTTNVDEMLERNLPDAVAVQSSDLERCIDLVPAKTSFVAKLHGSISAVQTTIFTTADYQGLLDHPTYRRTLEVLFAQATVLFVGYGLREKYVLELFEANREARPLFGDGPHFLIEPSESPSLPDSIRAIRYVPEPYADHRSAITVLDIVRVTADPAAPLFVPENDPQRAEIPYESGYFITDITPPGTWTSSQSITLSRQSGDVSELNALVGQGFDNSELPQQTSPAMHDLMVSLVSFDCLHIPLSYIGRLHYLLGPEMFRELANAGVFRFIHFEMQPAMLFRSSEAKDGGNIGDLVANDPDGSPITVEKQIRKQISPAPGREAEANKLFDDLAARVSIFDHTKYNIPNMTRGALLHPSVQRLLGISDAVLPTSLPRWVAFPVIRLAYTIMAGCACDNFRLAATKLGFGSEVLVGAAFAASAARNWTDSVSSYVLNSRFNTDLGAYAETTPSVWTSILAFRDTQAATNLRREILQELATNEGAEFVASVNAGLRQIVPTAVMDNARDQLAQLMVRSTTASTVVPAVWTNVRNSDGITRAWREKSRKELEAHCKQHGIKPKDQCPCGSGETLRDCCAAALKDR